MNKIQLFRRRYIPDEIKELKDDIVLSADDKMILTKWNVLKPRKDIARGVSAYFLDKGIKVSKVYDAEAVSYTHLVGATLGITKERADKYTMTVPIQKGTTAFIKKKGNDNIKTPEDMEGKVVGTQTSCYNEPDVKAYNEKLISNGGKGLSLIHI